MLRGVGLNFVSHPIHLGCTCPTASNSYFSLSWRVCQPESENHFCKEKRVVFDSCSGEEGGGTQLDKYIYNDKDNDKYNDKDNYKYKDRRKTEKGGFDSCSREEGGGTQVSG